MGAVTVYRQFPACSEEELRERYRDELDEMARESGSGGYSGNWTTCDGLQISQKNFATKDAAYEYLEKNLDKRDPVIAVRVGDFKTMFPESKTDKALVDKLRVLEDELFEFDRNIVQRAKQGKSKTRKCAHCESQISVKHLFVPSVKEMRSPGSLDFSAVAIHCGKYYQVNSYGLTDCPVCRHNLLRTATDEKAKASLQQRVNDLRKKVKEAEVKHAAKIQKKPKAMWVLGGCCAC